MLQRIALDDSLSSQECTPSAAWRLLHVIHQSAECLRAVCGLLCLGKSVELHILVAGAPYGGQP